MTRPGWRKWLQGGLIASLWLIIAARIQQAEWPRLRSIAAHITLAAVCLVLLAWLCYRIVFDI